MIISINWLKKFTDIDVSIDELATLIGSRLVEIEEVIDLGTKYKDVIVAKVMDCQKLEGSDHLNVTKLDDGGVVANVERDENGFVQVVCGAPNVREGMMIAWLPPGSVVPETANDDEPFVLGARKLRGAMSNGMIASARELALFDEHEGILEVDKDCAPGSKFVEVYELDDYLLDIENKSLTHRPDTFGIIGFAREVAAIQGKAFETPDILKDLNPQFEQKDSDIVAPAVYIDDEKLSNRYQAIILSGTKKDAATPLQIQSYLARVGVRPISPIVDVTNYIMMLTGQPLHAFDYDKVLHVSHGRNEIHVRAGRENEPLKLLDGRTIELSNEDIVIAAGETAIGLAGAMGGADTEIDATTQNVILESATFNLYNLRATQMRHGIFSEAITRFTKGQPAELTTPTLAWAVSLLEEYAGAVPVTAVTSAYPGERKVAPILLTIEQINQTLGSKFAAADAVDLMQNVEFNVEVQPNGQDLAFTPPYWRSDIHIKEDLIEEIGRLNGFDSIELTLPERDFTAVRPTSFDELRTRIRKILVRGGANEILSYSFVHGDILKKAGQSPDNSYRITNSISPELQYYRQTLTPSLLQTIHPNSKNGFDHFAVFEMNKTHNKTLPLTDEQVPTELNMLALTVASKKKQTGAAFYEAKRIAVYLGASLGLDIITKPFSEEPNYAVTAPFEWRRSAQVIDANSGVFIGIVGEYKKSVSRQFKLPAYAAGFELGTEHIHEAVQQSAPSYTPLSRYPGTERDICFRVTNDVSYAQITSAASSALRTMPLETEVFPVDIYQEEASEKKNITIRIKLTARDHTLDGSEVATYIEQVSNVVIAETKASVI